MFFSQMLHFGVLVWNDLFGLEYHYLVRLHISMGAIIMWVVDEWMDGYEPPSDIDHTHQHTEYVSPPIS